MPHDSDKAVLLFRKAAESGVATAQFNLGSCYELGEGVARDLTAAAKWYRIAAQQGHSDAQNNLGVLYQSGQGISQDIMSALRLYLLSAGNGNAKAAVNLAKVFHGSASLKPDHVLAYMWLKVAADWGEDVSEALRAEGALLNDRELAKGNRDAADWISQHRVNSSSTNLSSSLLEMRRQR